MTFSMQASYAKTQEQDEVKSYDGAQVWRTKLRGDEDVPAILKLVDDRGKLQN